ncbi:MAG TPA: type VII secretion protein EssC [Symbiobacteriaceae bacterium]|nr:type VII secretion protein EssC [Symbiobacteriaceae bacterium]
MAGPPVFQRSPRLRPEVPGGEVEIPVPPPAPSEPGTSLTSVLLSLAPGLVGALFMFGFARGRGAGSGVYLLYSLPMMAAGYLVQLGHLWIQRQRYVAAVSRREGAYRELLSKRRAELERARVQQQNSLRETDPSPDECVGRATTRGARLWERSPRDEDFLSIRLGLGTVASSVEVKLSRHSTPDEDTLFAEAEAVLHEFRDVTGVPIRLPLGQIGAAGIVGARGGVLETVRSVALQLAAHHSPDDLRIAGLFPAEEAGGWAGLRWLPHTWTDDRQSRLLACDRETAHRMLADLHDLLSRRKLQGAGVNAPAIVFIVGDSRLIESEPVLSLILREGRSVGAYALFLAAQKEDLPMDCRAIIDIGLRSQLILTEPGRSHTEFLPDRASVEQLETQARALAPLQPQRLAGPAEIPKSVSLFTVLAMSGQNDLNVMARWRVSEPYASLAAPVGVGAGGERLLLDLHERGHGPHGLVAGATGSGKSELLQTLVASLAVTYHPHEVAFVMVDYKGGGMANAFKGLPHLAATITNLEGGLARRALVALKSELKRRQLLLGIAGVSHIDEYIRLRRSGRVLEPLPHLILLVDEFAELKAEQPEFMRELISAVRVGRSLGVHLILATQKPAGVVDEQIWSNTRFRLCLRVERPGDSQEVLRSPDAAAITVPGRAYFQVGNNERFELFQAGWGGASAGGQQQRDPYEIAEVALDGRRYRVGPEQAAAVLSSETQLSALVNHLRAVAEREGLRPVQSPWMPPLPGVVALQELVPEDGRWLEPVAGLLDDPENQRQEPLHINLIKDGHLAVFGAPGTGKTTLIQTLTVSLARSHSPADLHMYLVDGSGRSLHVLEQLPHVGAVISGDEAERINRLLRHLLQELEQRKRRLSQVGVNTFAAYRQVADEPLPAIILTIDNFPALVSASENAEESVARLAREGGSHGIHLVVSAGSPSALRHRVGSNITAAVSLVLTDRSEYGLAVGRTGGLEPANLPGRGLVKGIPVLEFQTALPAEGEAEWERSASLRALCETLNRQWTGSRPHPIQALPDSVMFAENGGIGLEVESLAPFYPAPSDGPHFVISGPAAVGKSNLLISWLLATALRLPPDKLCLWLADPGEGGLSALQRLPHVRGYLTDGPSISAGVEQVSALLQERRQMPEDLRPVLVFAVDDYDLFRSVAADEVKYRLEQMIRRERGAGFHMVVAGPSGVFSQYGYEALTKALVEAQTGFVLGSHDSADIGLFGLQAPMGEARRLPPGLGYFVKRGRGRAVKTALVSQIGGWVEKIDRSVGGLV